MRVKLFDFSWEGMGHFQKQKSETWNENHFLAWNFLIFPNMVMSRLWRLCLNSARLKVCIQGERVTLEWGYPSKRVNECCCLQTKFHRLVFPITRVNFTNLDMKDYVEYLRLMIDSNLSWKYHTELICYKVSRSFGSIAKMQHYIPRRLLLQINNSLIVL